MGWLDKLSILKKAVEQEKTNQATKKSRSVCIHGEANCMRCATEDFEAELVMASNWQTLDSQDLRRVVLALPTHIREMMRRNPKKIIIAGGYIRAVIGNERVHDIDMFVGSKLDATTCLANTSTVFLHTTEEEKHIQFQEAGQEAQIIWRYPFTEAYEVLEQFDYTVVKAAIWFDDSLPSGYRSICHEYFYRDLARKLLVYNCNRDVERLESMPRLMKYANYGYTIEPQSLAEVVMRTCLSLDLDNGFEGIRQQLLKQYIATSDEEKWATLTAKYIPPKTKEPTPRSHDYSYGS